MLARKLLAILAALIVSFSVAPVKADERAYIDLLIQYYADYYDVPVELVHRVVLRESTYNPRARNGPYWGLMQILPATARTMGFTGQPEHLLDAETNLIYAVKYLRGAYIVAGGNQDRAVQHYARGYYYDARDKGLLEVTGLRPGPLSPVAPTPPTQTASVEPPPVPPARIPEFTPAVVASTTPAVSQDLNAQEPIVVALGFLPPQRPSGLVPDANAALEAIAAAEASVTPQDPRVALGASIKTASSYVGSNPDIGLKPAHDIFEGTFSMLEAISSGNGNGALLR